MPITIDDSMDAERTRKRGSDHLTYEDIAKKDDEVVDFRQISNPEVWKGSGWENSFS
jgi:hypothetical protein